MKPPIERFVRAILRRIPISDYWKTRAWGRHRFPLDDRVDLPYYRGIELAMRAVKSWYGVMFPRAAGYSMLEFGVAGGASLKAMLHFRDVWARALHITAPVTVIGFDTFEGLPQERAGDQGPWRPGDFGAPMDAVERELAGFQNYRLVKGLIGDTLPLERRFLELNPPVFVSVDVDYYSSTVDTFENLLDLVPHGAMFYFDDPSAHFWSNRQGELRAIREVNENGGPGHFVDYPLWIETREIRHYKQLYRYLDFTKEVREDRDFLPLPERKRVSPL